MNTHKDNNTALMLSALQNAHDAVYWEDEGQCACGMSDAATGLGAMAAGVPFPAKATCGCPF